MRRMEQVHDRHPPWNDLLIRAECNNRCQGFPVGIEAAAQLLGAEIEFFDAGDYPLRTSPEMFDRTIDLFHELKPSFVLTHALEGP